MPGEWEDAPAPKAAKRSSGGWEDAPAKGATAAPTKDAPRFDIPGDIGRAAGDSARAGVRDLKEAFPSVEDRRAQAKADRDKYGIVGEAGLSFVHDLGRMGSAAKAALDGLGILSSPITGATHAIFGSALSMLPGVTKEQGDQGVDQALMGLRPQVVSPIVNGVAGVGNKLGIGSANTRAISKIGRAISDGAAGGRPDGLGIAGELINHNGKQPLTIADVAGPEVKELLGQALRVPGPGRTAGQDFLINRDRGAGARITGDINDALGGNRSAFQTAGDLTNMQKADSAPAYDKALANDAYSPRLQQFLDEPVFKQGLNEGLKLERLDALAEGRDFDPLSHGLDIDAEGNWVTKGTPNMRVLDAGKRGLDAMIAAERNAVTGKLSPLGRSLSKARDAYVAELDILNPDYAAARAAFSGPAQSMDAMKEGASFMTMSPEEIDEATKQLATGDRQFFKLGAEQALRRTVAQTGPAGDEARAALRSNDRIAQVRAVFGDDKEGFDRLMKAAKNEEKMKGTLTNAIGNSRTEARAVQDARGGGAGFLSPALKAAVSVATQGPVRSGRGMLQNLHDRLTGMTPAVAERIQKLLLDPTLSSNPEELYLALLGRQPHSLPPSMGAGPSIPAAINPPLVPPP